MLTVGDRAGTDICRQYVLIFGTVGTVGNDASSSLTLVAAQQLTVLVTMYQSKRCDVTEDVSHSTPNLELCVYVYVYIYIYIYIQCTYQSVPWLTHGGPDLTLGQVYAPLLRCSPISTTAPLHHCSHSPRTLYNPSNRLRL